MDKLILRKGGHLFAIETEYDSTLKEYRTKSETEIKDIVPPYYLHHGAFELEDGLTMEDVFLFLSKDLSYWELVIGNHVSDFVKQSFETSTEPIPENPSLDILYVTWIQESTKQDGKRWINFPLPSLVGEGKYGDAVISVGIGNTHTASLNRVPVKIKKDLTVESSDFDRKFTLRRFDDCEDNLEGFVTAINHRTFLERIFPFWRKFEYWIERKISQKKYSFGEMEMSLFQFLFGIFYELSFYGPPKERKEFFDALDKQIENIKNTGSEKAPSDDC